MKNWKHSMSAFMAIVMVSSLATIQAKDMSAAFANKENEEISVDIQKENVKTVEIDEADSKKIKETVEEISALNKVEIEKPYEPKSGYVISTSNVLNVRAEKDVNSAIIARLNPGNELWLEGEYEDWYMISVTVDGVVKEGYVSKEFVTSSYDAAKEVLLENVTYEKATIGAGVELKAAPDMNSMVLETFEGSEDIIIVSKVNAEWSQVYTTDDYATGYVLNSSITPKNKMVLKNDVISEKKETIKAVSTPVYVYSTEGNIDIKAIPADDAEVKVSIPSESLCLSVKNLGEWVKLSYGEDYIEGYVRAEKVMSKEAYDAMKAEEARKAEEAKKAEEARKAEEAKKAEEARKAEEAKKAEAAKKAKETKKTSAPASTKQAQAATKATATPKATETEAPKSTPSNGSMGQQIVNTASKYLGVRYVYGGSTPSGFDCSGLVQYVCKQLGISLNRSSRDQYKNGVAVSKSNLQPGDLVFFARGSTISHVGIYAGNNEVIHSPRPGKVVCKVPMSYITYSSKYVGARRVY